jgi:hypothetical protein
MTTRTQLRRVAGLGRPAGPPKARWPMSIATSEVEAIPPDRGRVASPGRASGQRVLPVKVVLLPVAGHLLADQCAVHVGNPEVNTRVHAGAEPDAVPAEKVAQRPHHEAADAGKTGRVIGYGGVLISGDHALSGSVARLLSLSASWMAVTGRQKSQRAFSCQQLIAESAAVR